MDTEIDNQEEAVEPIESENKSKYWAAKDTEQCVAEAWSKIEKFYSVIRASRLLDLYRNAYWNRYSGGRSGGNLGIMGENGELTGIEVNHYSNMIQHVQGVLAGQRPTFDCKANNADFRSMGQAIMGNALLETIMREKGFEGVLLQMVDLGLTFGEGLVTIGWDTEAGAVHRYAPPEMKGEKDQHVGDVRFFPLTPLDVVRDTMKESYHDHSYQLVRVWQNRYDLMAKFPDLADEIESLPNKWNAEGAHPRIYSYQWSQVTGVYDSEDVEVWTLFHRKSEAVPDGRMLVFLAPDVVLKDGPLPYRRIPVFRFAPLEQLGTPFGYTNFHDLLQLQYALNSVLSTIVSNQAALGVQNVWVPAGSNLSWKEIVGGLNLVEGGTEPPQALNLLSTKQETFTLFDMLMKSMELVSGVNAVARGDPAASLKTGAALTMVQSMVVQFSTISQRAYVHTTEQMATEVLHQYQDNADLPHMVTITGQGNRGYVKEFVKDDIKNVDRVTIQLGNPLSATVAGRYNIAELMAQMGLVKTPQQLDMVLTTGRLEPVTQGAQKQMMLISAENERLMNGQSVMAAIFDDHALHIQENSTVLDSPESREDPTVVKNVTDHVLEHVELWQRATTDIPALLAAKGIQPAPQPMMPGMPGMPPPGMPPQGLNPRAVAKNDGGMPLPASPGSADQGGPGNRGPQMPTPPPGSPLNGTQPMTME